MNNDQEFILKNLQDYLKVYLSLLIFSLIIIYNLISNNFLIESWNLELLLFLLYIH